MTVKFSGIAPTRKMLQKIEKHISSPGPLEKIADEGIEIIREKTSKGLDYKHRKFEPYSKFYAQKKGSSLVNLKVTGKLLDKIRRKVMKVGHVKIYITAARAVIGAIHSQGIGKMPKREFFNINKSNIAKLAKKYYDDPLMIIMKRK